MNAWNRATALIVRGCSAAALVCCISACAKEATDVQQVPTEVSDPGTGLENPAERKAADQAPVDETPRQGAGERTQRPVVDPAPQARPNGPRDNPTPRTGGLGTGASVDLEPLDEPESQSGGLAGGVAVDAAPTLPPPTRVRRRMNLDQLEAALLAATGGIGWTNSKGASEFAALSLTLGKPNYTDVTNEDLEPGALFQKFLNDAAQSACKKLAAKDAAQPTASKRVLMSKVGLKDTRQSNPAGVDANLAALMLRFHSRSVDPKASELEPWRFLFETATKVSKNKPDQGWRAVCVALVLHPHFYTY